MAVRGGPTVEAAVDDEVSYHGLRVDPGIRCTQLRLNAAKTPADAVATLAHALTIFASVGTVSRWLPLRQRRAGFDAPCTALHGPRHTDSCTSSALAHKGANAGIVLPIVVRASLRSLAATLLAVVLTDARTTAFHARKGTRGLVLPLVVDAKLRRGVFARAFVVRTYPAALALRTLVGAGGIGSPLIVDAGLRCQARALCVAIGANAVALSVQTCELARWRVFPLSRNT